MFEGILLLLSGPAALCAIIALLMGLLTCIDMAIDLVKDFL